ncbi:MAG TPA: ABC transporter permease [Candidatus Limnocylindrales bacterium]|nr:ABC transporter permease [Candidatus Limnocylindrales bacterium]
MAVAITVSLTAFGAVLLAWSAGARETAAAYAGTEPASATILLDTPVDAATLTAIAEAARTRPEVLRATARTQFNSEVSVNGNQRKIPLQVFVATPDDGMRMAKMFPQSRSWPPGPAEIFLARDSLTLLDAAVGDSMTLNLPGGRPTTLRITDTVYDPSLSPSPQEQTARAYVSTAALADPPQLDQLKIQVAAPGETVPSRDRDRIVAIAGGVSEWLQDNHNLKVREVQVPRPYAHPHQWQADALLAALLAGAAASLLLSALLVASMLGNLFTQQIPQIGIMKAVGARPRHIGGLYLLMVLLVAATATALAAAPAIWLGRLAVKTFLGFLGIQPDNPSAPIWTVMVVLAAGLLLPVLMALPSLIRAARITVRQAIDHHGGAVAPGRAARLLTRLSAFPWLGRGLLMALRNTVRRPARFWLSAGLLATAGTVFVAGMSLAASTTAISQEQEQQRTWDVDVRLETPLPLGQARSVLARVPGVQAVDDLSLVPAGLAGPGRIPVTRTYPDQGHGRVAVTAIPDGATTFVPPKLTEGRWLRPGETGALVLNQITRANTVPDLKAGQPVQLIIAGKTTSWRVAGIAEERMGGGGGVYATTAGLAEALGRPVLANQLRVVTSAHDEPARQAAALAVAQALDGNGSGGASAESVSRRQSISEGHLGPVILILLGIALPLGVVGLIGLASAMSANVLDRIREFGVMHAVGARPKTVRRIVAAEGVFLAVISCLLAIVPALALTAVLGAGLGSLFFSAPLPYRLSLAAAAIWPAIAVLGALLAIEAAASRAARLTVREALSYL